MKWPSDNLKGIMALFVLACSFTYFFVITLFEKQADPQVIIAIVSANSVVLSYYFGSSQGANKKDELLASMKPNAVTTSGDINLETKSDEIK